MPDIYPQNPQEDLPDVWQESMYRPMAGKATDMWMCFNWNMATEWSEKQWADVHDLCGSLEDQTGRRIHDRDSDEKTK